MSGFNITVPLDDVHVTQYGSLPGDCTHYCHPGMPEVGASTPLLHSVHTHKTVPNYWSTLLRHTFLVPCQLQSSSEQ